MIHIKNVETIHGEIMDYSHTSPVDDTIDATGLTMLPALIDPHVHFRVPGGEHKEDWRTGAAAAIAGGVTTVFDMPNNTPPATTLERLLTKKMLIEKQLQAADIPLRYELYLGGHKDELAQIELAKSTAIGIKIFLGQSTGSLLMDDEVAFEELCRLAAEHDMVVAVHAEDDATIHENIKTLKHENSDAVALHSKIRSREAAMRALEKALRVGKKHKTRLYILHASTAEEVAMVRQAKKAGQHVFLETTPHHLFLTENDYAAWGTKVQMNPPLRTTHDQTALWAGIKDGTIDTVGTDHAPHTLAEKAQPYGTAPSGVPGIETLLPLLLTAARDGRLTLDDVVRVTRTNAEHIFRLAPNDDIVLVDIQKERPVRDEALKTKCGWSPFVGRVLTGWPVYTILKGKVYRI